MVQGTKFNKIEGIEMRGIKIKGREEDLVIYGVYRRPGKTV